MSPPDLRVIEAPGPGAPTSPADALAAARVDLIERIRHGIPEREFVPGCTPYMIRGKRYLWVASAGIGKSMGATVTAIEIVAHGGTVAIIDVENGADEYAGRVRDILADREELGGACSERLRYYAWPTLRADWSADEWAAALTGADLVIFDSSRLVLSAMGLTEDSNDDYATFANRMLIPLTRAGITTLVLDNTGHEDRDRGRGASAKGDLNEVVYAARVGKPFDRDQAGELHLHRKRTRFSDLPARLIISLGAGIYRAPVVADEPGDQPQGPFRPTTLMQRISEALEADPGLSLRAIRTAVKGQANDTKALALELLVSEGYVEARPEGTGRAHKHYAIRPYRAQHEAEAEPCPTVPDTVPGTPAPNRADRAPSLNGHGHEAHPDRHTHRAALSEPPSDSLADRWPERSERCAPARAES